MDRNETAVPGWFRPAAIAVILWEVLGCANYVMWMTADRAAMDADLRAVFDATPIWVEIAFAVAVASGLAGSVALFARRRIAEPLLLLSLAAIAVQESAWLVVRELREMVGSDDLLLPFLILMVCFVIWSFARRARLRGWLR